MRVVLGGIVKNISHLIPNTLQFLIDLKRQLPCLEVCIYENNSTDNTNGIFLDLATKIDFLEVKSEIYDNSFFLDKGRARTWDNLPCRIEMIAFARNKLLEMIHAKNLTDNDLVIMMDLDFMRAPDVKAIALIVENFPIKLADVLFANGVGANGNYYDTYVLRTAADPFGPEIMGKTFWSGEHSKRLRDAIPANASSLIPVYSAFGGLAIYRAAAIKGCFYSADVTDSLHAFYKDLLKDKPQEKPITHHEGVLLGCYLKGDNIFYRNNSGYNWPVVGEHSTFHAQMRENGFGKMFIVPSLAYYWV